MASHLLRLAALPVVLFGATTSVAWSAPQAAPTSYDLEEFDADALEDAVNRGSTYPLRVFGETYELRLERKNLRSPRFRMLTGSLGTEQVSFSGPPRTFAGEVVGREGSLVRMSTGPTGLRGYIKTDEGWTFIEPAEAEQAEVAQAHRVFTEHDLDEAFFGECSTPLVLDEDAEAIPQPPHEVSSPLGVHSLTPPTAPAGAMRVVELAIDADVEFFQAHGTDSLAEIESILNVVDGIFRDELDLTLEIVSVNIYESEPDPYTSTDSSTLLQELRNHWNTNHAGIARDAAHLFTGKELDGSTVGIAYVGVVCSTTVAYALSQDIASDALMPILVAHELGHNLNADHDASGSSPRYVMYPSLGVTNLDEFSAGSNTAIGNYVAGVGCLALESDSGDSSGGGGSSVSGGGGGGGGGGGPVDPLLLLLLLAAVLSARPWQGHATRGH